MLSKITDLSKFSKTLKVLYVEDNTKAREQTYKMLKNFFNNIVVATDGQEGLDKFIQDKDSFHIIFTDLNMPNMNGIEMLKNIRNLNKNIPVIILSAYSDVNLFLETIKLWVDGYILKPVDMGLFINTLFKALEKIRLEQENIKYKNNLEKKVQEQVKLLREKDKMVQRQSQLAAMGEMIDAIAHQWKQPLGAISTAAVGITLKSDMGMPIEKEELYEYSSMIQKQSTHLAETIDEFRSFFRPNTTIHSIVVMKIIESTLELLKGNIKSSNLNIIVDTVKDDIKIDIIPNEFKHVFINLINNAIDAFKENGIKKREIHIKVSQDKNYTIVKFIDNAGGIPEKIIDTLFNANVTTKEKGKGTGIGLYISKQIIEKYNGEITVKNTDNGAEFKIKVPKRQP